jgi:diacylglycerol kinase (ATP)
MSKLTIIGFNDKYKAEACLGQLRQLEKDGAGQIEEAFILVREDDGQFRQPGKLSETTRQAAAIAGGAGLGLLVGAALSLPVLGVVAGGLLLHHLTAQPEPLEDIREFSQALPPGSSVLYLRGELPDDPTVAARLSPLLAEGTLLHTNVPDSLVAQAQATAQSKPEPPPTIRRLLVIINPAAGLERSILRPLNRVFRPANIEWQVAITLQENDARRFAAAAAADGFDAVAIYGGDGSVMEAASGLLDSNLPLAILPGGTANVMATRLNIAHKLDEAAQLVARDQLTLRQIDLGQIGDHYFVLRAATGYEADYVKSTTREAKEMLGSLAYGLNMVTQSLNQIAYRLTLDGEPVEVSGYNCMIVNAGNYGFQNLPLLPNSSMSDGLLDVAVVQNLNFLSLLSSGKDDSNQRHQFVRHWQVREATIETDTPITLIGDGEVWGETPFTARVVPNAVRLIVP